MMMVGKRDGHGIAACVVRWASLGVLCLLAVLPVRAQLPDSLSSRARISVLTVNPGQAVHSIWGHSALRVMDPDGGFDAVFNWGTFDPTRPWFIPRFAYGDMQYTLSVESMQRFMEGARYEERGVIEQELRLDQNQRQAVWELLTDNMKPENRTYAYNFVRDNCSTRILDLLLAIDAIRLSSTDSATTYRGMVNAYLHQTAWLDLGINLVFGAPMDKRVISEDQAFLPLALKALFDEAISPKGEPLIRETRTLLDLPWEPTVPAFTRVEWLFWAIGILIVVHTFRARGGPSSVDRLLLGVMGSLGLFLLLMWLGTKHHATAWNADLLWALPTHVLVAVGWKRLPWLRTYLRVSAVVMGLALIMHVALQLMPTAVVPLVAACAVRFWISGSPGSEHPSPSTNDTQQ
jgi:hypothetical protein